MKSFYSVLGIAAALTSVQSVAGLSEKVHSLIGSSKKTEGTRVRWDGNALAYHTPQGVVHATVRAASGDDLEDIVAINRENYGHDNSSVDETRRWVKSHIEAKDFTRYYVITANNADGDEGEAIGYVLWSLDGGYHPKSTARIDQFATRSTHRGQGFAHALLRLSLPEFEKDVLGNINGVIDRIYGTLGSDFKEGIELYESALGMKDKGGVGALFNSNAFGKEEVFFTNEHVKDFYQEHPITEILN